MTNFFGWNLFKSKKQVCYLYGSRYYSPSVTSWEPLIVRPSRYERHDYSPSVTSTRHSKSDHHSYSRAYSDSYLSDKNSYLSDQDSYFSDKTSRRKIDWSQVKVVRAAAWTAYGILTGIQKCMTVSAPLFGYKIIGDKAVPIW
jgi:hypothetical protein